MAAAETTHHVSEIPEDLPSVGGEEAHPVSNGDAVALPIAEDSEIPATTTADERSKLVAGNNAPDANILVAEDSAPDWMRLHSAQSRRQNSRGYSRGRLEVHWSSDDDTVASRENSRQSMSRPGTSMIERELEEIRAARETRASGGEMEGWIGKFTPLSPQRHHSSSAGRRSPWIPYAADFSDTDSEPVRGRTAGTSRSAASPRPTTGKIDEEVQEIFRARVQANAGAGTGAVLGPGYEEYLDGAIQEILARQKAARQRARGAQRTKKVEQLGMLSERDAWLRTEASGRKGGDDRIRDGGNRARKRRQGGVPQLSMLTERERESMAREVRLLRAELDAMARVRDQMRPERWTRKEAAVGQLPPLRSARHGDSQKASPGQSSFLGGAGTHQAQLVATADGGFAHVHGRRAEGSAAPVSPDRPGKAHAADESPASSGLASPLVSSPLAHAVGSPAGKEDRGGGGAAGVGAEGTGAGTNESLALLARTPLQVVNTLLDKSRRGDLLAGPLHAERRAVERAREELGHLQEVRRRRAAREQAREQEAAEALAREADRDDETHALVEEMTIERCAEEYDEVRAVKAEAERRMHAYHALNEKVKWKTARERSERDVHRLANLREEHAEAMRRAAAAEEAYEKSYQAALGEVLRTLHKRGRRGRVLSEYDVLSEAALHSDLLVQSEEPDESDALRISNRLLLAALASARTAGADPVVELHRTRLAISQLGSGLDASQKGHAAEGDVSAPTAEADAAGGRDGGTEVASGVGSQGAGVDQAVALACAGHSKLEAEAAEDASNSKGGTDEAPCERSSGAHEAAADVGAPEAAAEKGTRPEGAPPPGGRPAPTPPPEDSPAPALAEVEFADGTSFSGEWRRGEPHGLGVERHPGASGRVYEGQVLNDLRHGLGALETLGGVVYEGMWWAGERHGVGVEGVRVRDARGELGRVGAVLPVALVEYEQGQRTRVERFGRQPNLERTILTAVREVSARARKLAAASALAERLVLPLSDLGFPGAGGESSAAGAAAAVDAAAGLRSPLPQLSVLSQVGKASRQERLQARQKERERLARRRKTKEARAREMGYQIAEVNKEADAIGAALNQLKGAVENDIGAMDSKMRQLGVISGRLYGSTTREQESLGHMGSNNDDSQGAGSPKDRLRRFLLDKNEVPAELTERIVATFLDKFGAIAVSEVAQSLEKKRTVLVGLSSGSEWHSTTREPDGKVHRRITKRYSGLRVRDGSPKRKKASPKRKPAALVQTPAPDAADGAPSESTAAAGTKGPPPQGQQPAERATADQGDQGSLPEKAASAAKQPGQAGRGMLARMATKDKGPEQQMAGVRMEGLLEYVHQETQARAKVRRREQAEHEALLAGRIGAEKPAAGVGRRVSSFTSLAAAAGARSRAPSLASLASQASKALQGSASATKKPRAKNKRVSLAGASQHAEKAKAEQPGGLDRFKNATSLLLKHSLDQAKQLTGARDANAPAFTRVLEGTGLNLGSIAVRAEAKPAGPGRHNAALGGPDAPHKKEVIQVPGDMRLLAAVTAFDRDKHSWIEIRTGSYDWEGTLRVDKELTIIGQDGVRLVGRWSFAAPDGLVTIQNVTLEPPNVKVEGNELRRLCHVSGFGLRLTDSAILAPKEYGLWVAGRAMLQLSGCILAGSEDGAVPTLGALVGMNWSETDVQDCCLENASGSCIYVDHDASCALSRCTVQDADVGILISDRARLHATDCILRVFVRGALGQMRDGPTEVALRDNTFHGAEWVFKLRPAKLISLNNTHNPPLWEPCSQLL